ncbi:MAG: ATP-binding protein [Deltaproteobacteria bacterium]|nr:ATP-binding protein [Deltaproteobacteria bacterium]
MNTFEEFRDKRTVYVDKTSYLPTLRKYGKVIFLSRPRRFGKSLTVSTLDSFYSGEKDLFKGLAAEQFMDSPDFAPRPVIHLDMSAPSGADNQELLTEKIIEELGRNAERHEVPPRGTDASGVFSNLIRDVQKAYSQKVVLLIDEYDAPVIKVIQDPRLSGIADLLRDTRSVMSDFYGKIKSADKYLEFVFITGVTKFSRMGVFSSLNNITDISLSPEFAGIVGFTHEELENNFKPFVRRMADTLDLRENVLLDQVRDYYDGFSFDGETRLYNPFSTMNFFGDMEFNNYWMESGSNTLIREMLRDKRLTVDQFRDFPVDADFASSPGEIEETPAHGFLYQAGYLTLRKKTDSSYALDYPNFEVLSSMSRLFIDNLFPSTLDAGQASIRLREHAASGNVPAMAQDFKRLYSRIAYDDHAAAKRLSMFIAIAQDPGAEVTRIIGRAIGSGAIMDETEKMARAVNENDHGKALALMDSLLKRSGQGKEIRLKLDESFCRSNLHSFLLGAGLKATAEIHSSHGRSDLVIEHKGLTYVIEMKVVEKAAYAETASQNALRQIVDLGYADSYDDPIILSLAVAEDTRNIAACAFVKGGRAGKIEFGVPSKKLLNGQSQEQIEGKLDKNKLSDASRLKKTKTK